MDFVGSGGTLQSTCPGNVSQRDASNFDKKKNPENSCNEENVISFMIYIFKIEYCFAARIGC